MTDIGFYLQGDTLGYCFNGMQNAIGSSSGSSYWGIKMPGSVVASGHVLTAVEYYVNGSGTYDLTIYTGTTSPTTTVYTQSYTLTDEDAWNTMTLSTPVTIPSDQNFWITLHDNGASYPCTYSALDRQVVVDAGVAHGLQDNVVRNPGVCGVIRISAGGEPVLQHRKIHHKTSFLIASKMAFRFGNASR